MRAIVAAIILPGEAAIVAPIPAPVAPIVPVPVATVIPVAAVRAEIIAIIAEVAARIGALSVELIPVALAAIDLTPIDLTAVDLALAPIVLPIPLPVASILRGRGGRVWTFLTRRLEFTRRFLRIQAGALFSILTEVATFILLRPATATKAIATTIAAIGTIRPRFLRLSGDGGQYGRGEQQAHQALRHGTHLLKLSNEAGVMPASHPICRSATERCLN
ncbi:hypothetical protein [Sphingomonas montanisoli]|uniref:hypothetical protein n=1 Tax=Sphingomonas montanisoli TaxID=2606412 RepID=UPI001FE479AD|nr:hypothetical protein [Sphingomonas montanisoli]